VLDDRGVARYILFLDDSTMFYMLGNASAEENGIYMCAVDGSNRAQIVAGSINFMQLYEGRLYFTAGAWQGPALAESQLQCYDPQTGETTTVLGKSVYFPYVYGDKILYQFDADGETLHVCDMDGGNDNKITDTVTYYPIFDGEYIYYVNGTDGNAVYRILPDGSGNQKLTAMSARQIVLSGDTLYFVGNEDGKIYRMDMDGSDARVFAEGAGVNERGLMMMGGNLYFFQGAYEGLCYVDMATGAVMPAMATPDPAPAPQPDNNDSWSDPGDWDYDPWSDPGDGDGYDYGDYEDDPWSDPGDWDYDPWSDPGDYGDW
jgi:hypothetical protein